MFSIHDVIDIAIRVEKNGEKTYRKAAERIENPGLASLLEFLADEELEHIRWFETFASKIQGGDASEELAQMGRSMLRGVVGDKSFSLDDVDLSQSTSIEEVLDAALELELDTVLFYQMLGGFVNDTTTQRHLANIIEEEKRHGSFLQDYLQTGTLPSEEDYKGLSA